MESAVPSLSSDGFITEIRKKADMVMAHYFASDYSQSNAFLGEVTSLAYQVQQYGSDTNRLKEEIETKLTRYLERYFDAASVTVTITDGTSANRYNIDFDAMVVKDNLRYSVGRLVEVQNGRLANIINRLQNG